MASNEQNKAGCRFMRKLLGKRDDNEELRVNFVQSIMELEDRFLAEEDKNFLILILKSVARGNLVMVKRIATPSTAAIQKTTQSAEASAMPSGPAASADTKLNPQDKENIKSVMEMFGTEHD